MHRSCRQTASILGGGWKLPVTRHVSLALGEPSIDLVSEYINNLLLYFQPDSAVTVLDIIALEFYKPLPGDLSVLVP